MQNFHLMEDGKKFLAIEKDLLFADVLAAGHQQRDFISKDIHTIKNANLLKKKNWLFQHGM